jgi:hypothetical protein
VSPGERPSASSKASAASPGKVACEQNERILNTYAINPGGTFTFEADNQATFRPQRQGAAAKVILACVAR